MSIKKSTLRKAAAVVAGLALISVLAFVVGPVVLVDAAEPTCGDGVCDTNSENNDLCPEDCQCIDNGVEDPGEGCGCKDVVCEDEGIASACGTPVGADGECPGNLVDSGGVCWDRCECQGICGEDDEAQASVSRCPDYSSGSWIFTGVPDTEPNPCAGGFTYSGEWSCYGSGVVTSADRCCSGSISPASGSGFVFLVCD